MYKSISCKAHHLFLFIYLFLLEQPTCVRASKAVHLCIERVGVRLKTRSTGVILLLHQTTYKTSALNEARESTGSRAELFKRDLSKINIHRLYKIMSVNINYII